MPTEKTILAAAWVAPMSGVGPLLRDGGVVIGDGRIIAVGAADGLGRRYPEAVIRDAGNAVILPGLVNAHVHLELSDAAPVLPRPGSFAQWLVGMVRRGGMRTEQQIAGAVEVGVAQCLRFGVSSVGDISRASGISRGVLGRFPLHGVSYGEVVGMGRRRGQMEGLLAGAVAQESRSAFRPPLPPGEGTGQRLRVGVSPHAPYSIEVEGYRRCFDVARERGLPLATHLAESADEAAFLAEHAGPLRELWEVLGAWDEDVPRFVGGPIRYAKALGLLDYPSLLAHVNYCDDAEMGILTAGKASVVYCPRTHAYFGHPPHRWREMMGRGINVAVGTDSCASSADLNLVDELRLMYRTAPEVAAETLWAMATRNAAGAIGRASEVGTLERGKFADAVVFDVESDDPLREVLEGRELPGAVWVGGDLVSAALGPAR